jgi:exoribonuclease II
VGDNVTNNVTNITNNNAITINNFGKEDASYVDHDTLLHRLLLYNEGVVQMIDDIFFNPDHPENMNVRIKSTKRGTAEILKDGVWNVAYLKDVIPLMITRSSSLLFALLIGNIERGREYPDVVMWFHNFRSNKQFREITGLATMSLINKTRQQPVYIPCSSQ